MLILLINLYISGCGLIRTCLDKSSYIMSACFPLSLKYSPIAQPEYGAKYWRGAASEAVALTIIVYFMASRVRRGCGQWAWPGRQPLITCVGEPLHQLSYRTSLLTHSNIDAVQFLG